MHNHRCCHSQGDFYHISLRVKSLFKITLLLYVCKHKRISTTDAYTPMFMDVCLKKSASLVAMGWIFFDQHFFLNCSIKICCYLLISTFLTSFQVIPFTHTSPHEFRWSVTVTYEFIAMTLFVCCYFSSL